MLRSAPLPALLAAGLVWLLITASAGAQPAPAAASDTPSTAPVREGSRLPQLKDLQLELPGPVRSVSAALGLGRQRLALVVGNAKLGTRTVLDAAPRDSAAVAQALRAAGFVVMLREDLGAAALRAELKEFRERLQPGGLGFVYVTGLGAQLQGRNLLLVRDTPLDAQASAATVAEALQRDAMPLSELIDALLGTASSTRLLVVDAAFRHPALDRLPQAGLAEPRLPPGMMALFGQALGSAQDPPPGGAPPGPPPAAPRDMAASRFAQALVAALSTPRLTGPDALRAARRALVEDSQGRLQPWLGGDTEDREPFTDGGLLDSLLPRSPDDLAREVLKKGAQQTLQASSRAAGEQTVAEVLASSAGPAPEPSPEPAAPQPGTPSQGMQAAQAAQAAGTGAMAGPLTGAAGALGAAASMAATVGTLAASVAATQAASSGASLLGSAGGNAAALVARGGGAGEAPAARALAQSAGRQSADGAVPTAAAAPVAPVPPVGTVTPAAAATPFNAVASAAGSTSAAMAAQDAVSTQAAQVTRAAPAAPSLPRDPSLSVPVAPAAAPAAARGTARPALDSRTERTGDAGERPVYQPRTNNFGHAEGDTFTYRVTDTWKGEVTGSYTTAIEEVSSDGELLANGNQLALDAQGRVKSQRGADGAQSVFEPVQEWWWAQPQRGQTRELRFTERFDRPGVGRGEALWTGSASVGRPRRIDLPAGTFEVLPIESSGWVSERVGQEPLVRRQWSRTVWYAPRLGQPVAVDSQERDAQGQLLQRQRVELLHAQTSRPAP